MMTKRLLSSPWFDGEISYLILTVKGVCHVSAIVFSTINPGRDL